MSKQQTTIYDVEALEESIQDHLKEDRLAEATVELRRLRPSDLERFLDRTSRTMLPVAFRLLDKDAAVTVFETMEPQLQSDLIDGLQTSRVQEIFGELESTSQARLLDEVPAEVAQRLLSGLSAADRNQAGRVLGYPEDAVGRRLTPITVELSAHMTATEALQAVRAADVDADDENELATLPVASSTHKVLGLVDLTRLVRAEPDTLVRDIMHDTDTVNATEEAEVAARMAVHHRVQAVPVVDDAERLIGMLLVDDAQRILEEEESEDTYRSGGAEPLGQPYLTTSIMQLVKSRIVWLLVLAIGATLTVQVLQVFEEMLAVMVALTLFIPLLTGTGGNTGNQAATTVTRAIALGQVTPRDVWRVIGREALVGCTLGACLGVLGFVITGLIFGWDIGTVIGLTLLAICTVAATVGSMMPLIASKIGVDPAVFSNPFISTVVDALGLIIYFMVAQSVLGL
ncbi:magnesium transporter [Auritidibacter ignavus]|uniref:magnesium transporter n=1 Tax=Auritidibacter ignavus TaxID=678932 RepID=UPI0024B89318|nr:magnesium transporter [Auritidibacter ignavus]WHS27283.1 magnesium transporter [Auritidibacter ignavus]